MGDAGSVQIHEFGLLDCLLVLAEKRPLLFACNEGVLRNKRFMQNQRVWFSAYNASPFTGRTAVSPCILVKRALFWGEFILPLLLGAAIFEGSCLCGF